MPVQVSLFVAIALLDNPIIGNSSGDKPIALMTSPFAPYKNSVLRFQVASGSMTIDRTGNVRPRAAIVTVEALLKQAKEPRDTDRPGVDSTLVWLEGYVVSVENAPTGAELKLPSLITPASPCAADWQGRSGKFHYQFKEKSPYLAALNIDLVNPIQGWFEPASFVVEGDPYVPPSPTPTPTPTPTPAPTPSGSSYERTFTQSDLSIANLLPVTHNLNTYPSAIAIYTNTGEQITSDGVQHQSVNALAIDLSSFVPITGTWTLSIGE